MLYGLFASDHRDQILLICQCCSIPKHTFPGAWYRVSGVVERVFT